MNNPPPLPAEKPVDRAMARRAFLINQFATPGLGSLMARRWVAGIGQLLVACAGFLMFVGWFIQTIIGYYSLMSGDTPPPTSFILAIAGVVVFAVSWFWSLATSISLLREAGRNSVPKG